MNNEVTKIFLFGYFGWYNIGDDSIGLSILKELFDKYPTAEFLVTTNNPYFISENKIQKATPIEFNFLSILKALIKADRFIISGGTHLQDEDKFIFLVLKTFLFFSIISICANFLGKPPILLANGIGPVTRQWAKFLLKIVLINSQFIIVRDSISYDFVCSFGLNNKCLLGFDPAILLINRYKFIYNENYNNKYLGISLIPFNSIYAGDPSKDEFIINTFVIALKRILSENEDIFLKLFAFRSGNRHSDEKIVVQLSNELNQYSNRINIIVYNGNIHQFLIEIASCYAFIGMRYHSSLFAYLFCKPLILIDYQEKCRGLARDIAINKRSIISIKLINFSIMTKKIDEMIHYPLNYSADLPIIVALNLAKDMFNYI